MLSPSPNRSLSPFFTFPREIRDTIYLLLWDDYGIVFKSVEHSIIAAPRGRKFYEVRNGLPLWVRTCRLMMEEGVECFARTRVFSPVGKRDVRGGDANGDADGDGGGGRWGGVGLLARGCKRVRLGMEVPGAITMGVMKGYADDDWAILDWDSFDADSSNRLPPIEKLFLELDPRDAHLLFHLRSIGANVEHVQISCMWQCAVSPECVGEAMLVCRELEEWVGRLRSMTVQFWGSGKEIPKGFVHLVEGMARRLVGGEADERWEDWGGSTIGGARGLSLCIVRR